MGFLRCMAIGFNRLLAHPPSLIYSGGTIFDADFATLSELVLENGTIWMPQSLLPVTEFRRLLIELRDHRPDISTRVRMTGQMWMRNFAQIIRVTEKGVLLRDESSGEFITINDLSNVMQFELDRAFRLFQPYFFYEILPFLH